MYAKMKKIGCKKCHHQGYLVSSNDECSFADVCECVNSCSECGGTGLISFKKEESYNYVNKCNLCGDIQRNVKRYNQANIPAKFYRILKVDSYAPRSEYQQKALKYVKDSFVKQYPNEKGFLLMGPSGVGKTHLAIGAISELALERGIKCIFKDFFLLLSELKQAYSEGTSENEVLLPLIEAEVLVIDELGKGKSNEWELNILDQLISKRYNASKNTLITTNYIARDSASKNLASYELLENRVGERILSRLYEMCKFIHIEGKDFRKEA